MPNLVQIARKLSRAVSYNHFGFCFNVGISCQNRGYVFMLNAENEAVFIATLGGSGKRGENADDKRTALEYFPRADRADLGVAGFRRPQKPFCRFIFHRCAAKPDRIGREAGKNTVRASDVVLVGMRENRESERADPQLLKAEA